MDFRSDFKVSFIESSEKAKASIEGQAVRLADRIVPYSFLLAGVVGLATRNLAKVAAVLMVDYSCALKLATPIAFLRKLCKIRNFSQSPFGGFISEESDGNFPSGRN